MLDSYVDLFVETQGSFRKLTLTELNFLKSVTDTCYKYVIYKPYEIRWRNKIIRVPIGFLSDGATGAPDIGTAWIYHDYLYSTHRFTSGEECSREEADLLMKIILEREGLPCYKKVYCWVKDYFFGLFRRAWYTSGVRGPEFLQDLISPGILPR
jgi:hypothetical protein